jgi:hypothetical protein
LLPVNIYGGLSTVFRKSLKEVTEEEVQTNKRMDSRELLSLARASEDDKR